MSSPFDVRLALTPHSTHRSLAPTSSAPPRSSAQDTQSLGGVEYLLHQRAQEAAVAVLVVAAAQCLARTLLASLRNWPFEGSISRTRSIRERKFCCTAPVPDSLPPDYYILPPSLQPPATHHHFILPSTMSDSDSEHSDAPETSKPANRVRAPLTDEETKTVKAMLRGFRATDSAYCCSGHVPVEVERPGIFYAITPATFVTKWTKDETPIFAG